ncbi:DUF3618 domain-containing protein [Arthrobacter sp. ISL-65]|uniref:DUF3618 domain-containing protein n=1 Tax=Arthrobacter sp. ISL-65 TaxID=2819112 RepID=UPI001BEB48C2|nr:DUF3618 domain-containing protein [Arthrobacter sp. ISL-65]MBT2551324.1 DUF3618 domain-containing protein [Arthrobacter sp. ISL-65]
MSTSVTPPNPEPSKDAGIEDIKHDIEQTREELGQTVQALTTKLDVKAQAKNKAASLKDQATSSLTSGKEQAAGAVASAQARLDRLAQQAKTYQAEHQQRSQALVAGVCAVAGALIAIIIGRSLRRRTGADDALTP